MREDGSVHHSIGPGQVPPLRLRFREAECEGDADEVVDIAWSPDGDDVDPPSIAFVASGGLHPASKSTWDVEDPTDPDNEEYPPEEAAVLRPGAFVRCAASHWQRVHPLMRRFTQTELEAAGVLVGLGNVKAALDMLVDVRPGVCSLVWEPHPAYHV